MDTYDVYKNGQLAFPMCRSKIYLEQIDGIMTMIMEFEGKEYRYKLENRNTWEKYKLNYNIIITHEMIKLDENYSKEDIRTSFNKRIKEKFEFMIDPKK
ncbi:MAG: hypothetical protein MI717_09655 [Spirochaetales bacterium]|nr:hypothetical protein [Spirochaetales bacterium]